MKLQNVSERSSVQGIGSLAATAWPAKPLLSGLHHEYRLERLAA